MSARASSWLSRGLVAAALCGGCFSGTTLPIPDAGALPDSGPAAGVDAGPDAGPDAGSGLVIAGTPWDGGLDCPPGQVSVSGQAFDLCQTIFGRPGVDVAGVTVATDPPSTVTFSDATGHFALCVPAGQPFTPIVVPTSGIAGYLGELVLTTNQSLQAPLLCPAALAAGLGPLDVSGKAVVVSVILSLASSQSCGEARQLWSVHGFDLAGNPLDAGALYPGLTPGPPATCPQRTGVALFSGLDPSLGMIQLAIAADDPCDAGAPAGVCYDLAAELGFTGRLKLGPRPDVVSLDLHFLP